MVTQNPKESTVTKNLFGSKHVNEIAKNISSSIGTLKNAEKDVVKFSFRVLTEQHFD